MTPEGSARPLEGVRVLDFGQYVAGPMAATLLADAGAEVTRIEPPDGPRFSDPGNAYLLRGRTATHVLDLKSPAGQAAAHVTRTAAVPTIRSSRRSPAPRRRR